MKQLILVEGLPGTGKTTITRKISEHLISKGEKVTALFEGDDRIPCEFYETAGVPIDAFEEFYQQYPETPDNHYEIMFRTANYVFLKLNKSSDMISKTFRKWDMGDEHNQFMTASQYISCALERLDYWAALNIDHREIMVIDSGFLQNPINELLFRKASDQQIFSFIQAVIERFKPLNPFCFYLKRENADAAISFAKRIKGSDWASRVESFLIQFGCPNFFNHRFEIELLMLPFIPHTICSVRDDDWSDAESKIDSIF